jgi:hypothetical protein
VVGQQIGKGQGEVADGQMENGKVASGQIRKGGGVAGVQKRWSRCAVVSRGGGGRVLPAWVVGGARTPQPRGEAGEGSADRCGGVATRGGEEAQS